MPVFFVFFWRGALPFSPFFITFLLNHSFLYNSMYGDENSDEIAEVSDESVIKNEKPMC